ncbi:glycosyl transferase, group 1 family protein domain protein [Calothrix sp. NIES-2100]|uniref:glycosyltransferase n=1 Tax=Calothrix sp. NIES-2100 TaxID=1954172 RepID=UPI000B5E46B1|nr:glycosyl transferase, group 1 family protein domain protein [Calothrix sp. NIES-2100]
MKIWHITQTIYGGSGQYAIRLSNSLNTLGHQSIVLVKHGDSLAGSLQLSNNTNFLQSIVNRATRSVLNRVATEPYHTGFRLDRWAIDELDPPDIIHLHGLTGWIGFKGLRNLIQPHTPVFWTAHDLWMLSGGCVVYKECDLYQMGCPSCSSLKQPFSRWSRLEWLHKFKFIQDYNVIPIANSNWMAHCIRQSPLFSETTDIAIIPPIISPEFFEKSYTTPLREEFGIPSNRIVIGLGARTVTDAYKGIAEFIQYFSQSSYLCDHSTLLIFGDGELETPSNLHCRFLGRLSNTEQVKRFFQACNVFVSSSRMETFGMTLLEAQASATPVVTFRVGGTSEAVCHLKHGWLAEVGDFDSLIFGLHWILENLEKANTLGKNASFWAKENFSSSLVGKKQINVYSRSFTNF